MENTVITIDMDAAQDDEAPAEGLALVDIADGRKQANMIL